MTTLDSAGNSVPIEFTGSTGTSIALVATDIFLVGENIGAQVTGEIDYASVFDSSGNVNTANIVSFSSPMTIFILLSNKKVYDMTGYDLKHSISTGTTMYVVKLGTAYEISYSNFALATPLNNGAVTTVTALNFLANSALVTNFNYQNGYMDGYYRFDDDPGYSSPMFLLDATGATPPRVVKPINPGITNGDMLGEYVRYGNPNYQIFDASGTLWGFDISGGNVFKISCDSSGTTSVANVSTTTVPAGSWGQYDYVNFVNSTYDYTNGGMAGPVQRSLKDKERTIFRTSGIAQVTRNPTSGISIGYYPSSAMPDNNSTAIKRFRASDNEILWTDTNTIYYLKFDTTSHAITTKTLYSSVNFVSTPSTGNALTMKGRRVYFNAYQNAATVGVYYIDLDDAAATPVLSSLNDMPVSTILEAVFNVPVPSAPVVTVTGSTISWSAVTGATSYAVYWSTNVSVTTATGTLVPGIAGSSYTPGGLTSGTTYYFVVTALNNGGESVASQVVSMTAP